MRMSFFQIVGSILMLIVACSTAYAQSARRIAQQVFPSVVLLVTEDNDGQPLSLGSGFFVRDGVVATNLHVVEGAGRAYVKLVGRETMYDVDGIVGLDRDNDLARISHQ